MIPRQDPNNGRVQSFFFGAIFKLLFLLVTFFILKDAYTDSNNTILSDIKLDFWPTMDPTQPPEDCPAADAPVFDPEPEILIKARKVPPGEVFELPSDTPKDLAVPAAAGALSMGVIFRLTPPFV